MSFFDEVEGLFGTRCLYATLNVGKDADEKQLKKAYHKISLQCHPDRVNDENKENSKKKFQVLSKIHSILSSSEHRAVYDDTGEVLDEDDILTQQRDWSSYWRILFKKVSTKDIEIVEKEFRETNEEIDEIKKYYLEFEGDMEQIINNVMCATEHDEQRFQSIIQKCIEAGEIPAFKAFTAADQGKRRKRKERATKEEKESAQHAKDLGLDSDSDLKQLMLKRNTDRQKEMSNFFEDLEAKYCQPKQKKANSKNATSKTAASKSTKRKRK